MDAPATPRQSISLVLEINRGPDGRLDGQIRTKTASRWMPFSGVLELLKVLQDILDDSEQRNLRPAAPSLNSKKGTS
jgi:hypothetical protein